MGRKPKIKVADAGGGGEAESSAVYDAKKLVGKRMVGGRIEYKVRWAGYSAKDDTWEDQSNIHAKSLIDSFEVEQREKRGGRGRPVRSLGYFIPLEKYEVENGRRLDSILGLDQDPVHGVIALVIYEPVAGEEKRRAELVPTRVLMDNEEASVVLIHYYEAKPLVLAL